MTPATSTGPSCPPTAAGRPSEGPNTGAGDGNRTRVTSLEGTLAARADPRSGAERQVRTDLPGAEVDRRSPCVTVGEGTRRAQPVESGSPYGRRDGGVRAGSGLSRRVGAKRRAAPARSLPPRRRRSSHVAGPERKAHTPFGLD